MENPTYAFRDTNLVSQLIKELRIKSKTVMSWSSRKKKKWYFFVKFILSQYILYWINFQNIYTFTYQKTLLYTLLACF